MLIDLQQMRLTVLMPVFNAARHLDDALASIAKQSFTDFELLVIDDGSVDGSAAIVARHAQADTRIRLVRQERRGLVATLNPGLAMARGELIARMDADDVAVEHRLAHQVRFLDEHPNVAVVGTAVKWLADGRLISPPPPPLGARQLAASLPRQCPLIHPTVMARKQALIEAGSYRPAFQHAEDYDLWLRVAERRELANLPDVLLHYRIHNDQVSMRHMRQQAISTLAAQVAAQHRVRKIPEPFTTDDGPVTDEALRLAGVTRSQIQEATTELYEARVGQCLLLGHLDDAQHLIGELLAEIGNQPTTRRTRASLRWMKGRQALSQRRILVAGCALAGSCLADPSRLGHLVKSLVRRRTAAASS